MRAIILSLVLATTAMAQYPEYNIQTGDVWLRDIPAGQQSLRLYIPSIHATSRIGDGWTTIPDESRWLDTLVRHSYHVPSGGRLHNYIVWQDPFGYEGDIFLGKLMVPGADNGWEDEFRDSTPNSKLQLDFISANGYTDRRSFQFQIVPEPEALYLGVLGFVAIVTASRIWRMR